MWTWLGLLVFLTGATIPAPRVCAASQRIAAACAMPCCQKSSPVAPTSCPQMRAEAPKDVLLQPLSTTVASCTVVVGGIAESLAAWHSVHHAPVSLVSRRSIHDTSPHIGPAPPALA